MVIHKKTRLTPVQRQEIYSAYHTEKKKVAELAREYQVSRPTIYKILKLTDFFEGENEKT